MVSPDASGTKMVMFGTKPVPVRELRAPTTLTLLKCTVFLWTYSDE
jgi:hypothetical protein